MVELEAWYDQEPENDFGPGDPAIILRTPEELDTFIDRVREETKDHRVPAMVQINIAGKANSPVLEVGLGEDKGFIVYHAEDGGSTKGTGDPTATVEYTYVGNLSEVPADVEVPLDEVRRGLHEFLRSGEKPSVVR